MCLVNSRAVPTAGREQWPQSMVRPDRTVAVPNCFPPTELKSTVRIYDRSTYNTRHQNYILGLWVNGIYASIGDYLGTIESLYDR